MRFVFATGLTVGLLIAGLASADPPAPPTPAPPPAAAPAPPQLAPGEILAKMEAGNNASADQTLND